MVSEDLTEIPPHLGSKRPLPPGLTRRKERTVVADDLSHHQDWDRDNL